MARPTHILHCIFLTCLAKNGEIHFHRCTIKENYEEVYIKKVMKLRRILAILSIRFAILLRNLNRNERNLIKVDEPKFRLYYIVNLKDATKICN